MVGVSFSRRAPGGGIWPDGAGMPDPSRKRRQPTRLLSRPSVGGLMHGRLRWLCRLPLGVCRHAKVSTVPRVQGQGRPPGQATEWGKTMTEASMSMAYGDQAINSDCR